MTSLLHKIMLLGLSWWQGKDCGVTSNITAVFSQIYSFPFFSFGYISTLGFSPIYLFLFNITAVFSQIYSFLFFSFGYIRPRAGLRLAGPSGIVGRVHLSQVHFSRVHLSRLASRLGRSARSTL